MKLISKFHDYYDKPFQQSASDPKFIFIRNQQTLDLIDATNKYYETLPLDTFTLLIDNEKKTLSFEFGIVGFCGILYPYIKYNHMIDYSSNATHLKEPQYFYNIKDLYKTFPSLLKYTKVLYNRFVNTYSDIEGWLNDGSIKFWNHTYKLDNDNKIKNLFKLHNVAYFNISPSTLQRIKNLEIYPILKNLEFYKVFDTYSAFQQVEMYITNNLVVPDKVILPIPDKIKAESKGFDKWSFRKMSDKKG